MSPSPVSPDPVTVCLRFCRAIFPPGSRVLGQPSAPSQRDRTAGSFSDTAGPKSPTLNPPAGGKEAGSLNDWATSHHGLMWKHYHSEPVHPFFQRANVVLLVALIVIALAVKWGVLL